MVRVDPLFAHYTTLFFGNLEVHFRLAVPELFGEQGHPEHGKDEPAGHHGAYDVDDVLEGVDKSVYQNFGGLYIVENLKRP